MKLDQVSSSIQTSGVMETWTTGLADNKRDKIPTPGNNCHDAGLADGLRSLSLNQQQPKLS